jgi:hypothetical protein
MSSPSTTSVRFHCIVIEICYDDSNKSLYQSSRPPLESNPSFTNKSIKSYREGRASWS